MIKLEFCTSYNKFMSLKMLAGPFLKSGLVLLILCILPCHSAFPISFQHCDRKLNTHNDSIPLHSKTLSSRPTPKQCPPWTYLHQLNSTKCECGNRMRNIIHCDNTSVGLLICHCMSYNEKLDAVLMGSCPYLCKNAYYIQMPCNVNDLDDLCSDFNRTGQFCGKCSEGYAPAAYTYTSKCVQCSSHNWVKYLLVAYLPLTVFFIIVVFLRINAMSASLNAYILVCQILSSPAVTSALVTYVHYSEVTPVYPEVNQRVIMGTMLTLYSVWNLDFFRYVYTPFCLHPTASTMDVIALDYAIAIYPMLLIFITYCMVKLHDSIKVVQIMWKPMAWLFAKLNKDKGINTSLIEAFGTFFLLSYVKIVNTSVDLLMPVRGINVTGNVVGKFLYYNGSLEHFSPSHMPYALLAIFMFIAFNLVPLLLLCLYPCRCFQSCLNLCRLNSQVLRTFMDAFQGCYKFEPYDCRYFSGFYLFLRIAFLWNFDLSKYPYFVVTSGLFTLPLIIALLIIRPYRSSVYNTVDVVFLLMATLFMYSATSVPMTSFDLNYLPYSVVMCIIGLIFPALYALALTVYTVLPKSGIVLIRKCFRWCMLQLFIRYGERPGTNNDESDPLLQNSASASLNSLTV